MIDALHDALVTTENVGGRTLRVAQWRMDQRGDQAPILFFNGIGANMETIAPFIAAMDDRAFIMFDMPGIGQSPDPVMPYNPATICLTAVELLDQLGVDCVDIIGLSWGGGIAQQFAMQHHRRTRRLVLAATSAGMLIIPGSPKALGKIANPLRYLNSDYMMKNFRTLYGAGVDSDPDKEGHASRLSAPSPWGYLSQVMCMAGWTSAPALPFLLKQDTLIMVGDKDDIVSPANGDLLKLLIPNSQIKTIKGAGHMFLLSHKEESASAISEFFGSDEEAADAA